MVLKMEELRKLIGNLLRIEGRENKWEWIRGKSYRRYNSTWFFVPITLSYPLKQETRYNYDDIISLASFAQSYLPSHSDSASTALLFSPIPLLAIAHYSLRKNVSEKWSVESERITRKWGRVSVSEWMKDYFSKPVAEDAPPSSHSFRWSEENKENGKKERVRGGTVHHHYLHSKEGKENENDLLHEILSAPFLIPSSSTPLLETVHTVVLYFHSLPLLIHSSWIHPLSRHSCIKSYPLPWNEWFVVLFCIILFHL